jgi:hypothetical protein
MKRGMSERGVLRNIKIAASHQRGTEGHMAFKSVVKSVVKPD